MCWPGCVYRNEANYISVKSDTRSIRLMVVIGDVDGCADWQCPQAAAVSCRIAASRFSRVFHLCVSATVTTCTASARATTSR
ncbi:MAG: hypothetical protein CVV15_11450 [Gammaproteobacteria bacterium HGW-Gammaproteobacteria-5]|nr:MAG: hypothetical protein CVV15_11450 [Gammaproteobacteria bacterium HGW-Gammaproteobacteria-5]